MTTNETIELPSEMKHTNIEDLKATFIGKTTEYINGVLNTVLDDPVLLRVAIRFLEAFSKSCRKQNLLILLDDAVLTVQKLNVV